MLALSILQPWAHGIVHLGKDIENRDWRTSVRGTVAVHASRAEKPEEFDYFFRVYLKLPGKNVSEIPLIREQIVYGAIVGLVDVTACVDRHDSIWFHGRYGFVLENPRPLKNPVPCRGKLNFWTVPPEIERQVREQLSIDSKDEIHRPTVTCGRFG